MREMKDSGVKWIGEIPGDWNVFRNKNAFICKKEIIGKKSYETQLLSLTTKGIKKKGANKWKQDSLYYGLVMKIMKYVNGMDLILIRTLKRW